jgi:Sap, sulfolipid-1-addressing protein
LSARAGYDARRAKEAVDVDPHGAAQQVTKRMVLQAAGLAVLASLSPTALLIASIFLGSARPRLTAGFYLVGAVIMTVVMGVVLIVVLRSLDLNSAAEHTPRYGFRLGLGVMLLATGVAIAMRKPREPSPRGAPQGFVTRLAARPAPASAFIAGVVVFAPGASFLAAVQVIATARASIDLTVLAFAIVVVINVLLVWVPLLVHLAAPRLTTRYLTRFNEWLRVHGRVILTWVLIVVGAIMAGNGIYGLAVVR